VRLPDARWMSAYVPVRLQQRMHDTTDVKTAARIREEFMQMHPEVRKIWEDHGPLTVQDFSKLEEHVLATLPEIPIKAISLRPGDTLKSGDVVNSTEQLEDRVIKVNWDNGTSERYHYTEIFKVVMRRMGV
jgi:hypothetical protein